MKKQIVRLSPHQNAKVFAVLMAIGSLVFLVPVMLLASAFGPEGSGPGFLFILVLPVVYLIIGYLSIAAGSWLYNIMFPFIGGVEFEWREGDV